jgi:hypothetical protein
MCEECVKKRDRMGPFRTVLGNLKLTSINNSFTVFLACPEGLEPPTSDLEGRCSIQLSYGQTGLILEAGSDHRFPP